MRKTKALAITLLCLATLIASSSAAPRKRGTPSCCRMSRCCYSDMRCCKKANHACCTGKHTKGGECCCKKDSCPMPKTGQ